MSCISFAYDLPCYAIMALFYKAAYLFETITVEPWVVEEIHVIFLLVLHRNHMMLLNFDTL